MHCVELLQRQGRHIRLSAFACTAISLKHLSIETKLSILFLGPQATRVRYALRVLHDLARLVHCAAGELRTVWHCAACTLGIAIGWLWSTRCDRWRIKSSRRPGLHILFKLGLCRREGISLARDPIRVLFWVVGKSAIVRFPRGRMQMLCHICTLLLPLHKACGVGDG